MKFEPLLAAVMATGLVFATTPAAKAQQVPAGIETLAEYPTGAFLENLEALPDGRIVFTSYFAKTIEVVVPGSAARTFADLSAHPVSIRAIDGGYLVAAHGQAFNSGSGFTETQQFLLLDRDGREIGNFKAPAARFLNGMIRHTGTKLLVADSIAGTIWQVDAKARTIQPWLKDAALTQSPTAVAPTPVAPTPVAPTPVAPAPVAAAPAAASGELAAAAPSPVPAAAAPPAPAAKFQPGANGIKRYFDKLVISNSSRGTLSVVTVGKTGNPEGPVKLLAEVGPIDDFAVGADGTIVFATHGASLKQLARNGAVSTVMASGCDGCTAVAFVKGKTATQRDLVVLTTGGLLDGGKTSARVLRLPYQPPAKAR